MLSKYNMYPTFGGLRMQHTKTVRLMMEILCYTDGKTSVESISQITSSSKLEVQDILDQLSSHGVITEI